MTDVTRQCCGTSTFDDCRCEPRALSQTLPAPGEVGDIRKRAQSIWDKRWFCIEGEWTPDQEPVETDEPRRFAEIAIDALPPTLATVAAANDEGVAEAFARGVEAAAQIAERVPTDPTVPKYTLDAHIRVGGSIAAAIRLLSQGEGK